MFLKKDDKKQQVAQQKLDSTQKYLEIDQIKDDVLILKDNSLRSIIMTSGINMELRSGQEQDTIINMYQSALNSLDFPIQIVVQSRKVDLTSYLAILQESAVKQTVPLLAEQTFEYISFLKDILTSVNVMDKKFFVVVPYYPNVIGEKSSSLLSLLGMNKKTPGQAKNSSLGSYDTSRNELGKRVQIVCSLLGGVGLTTTPLPTQALIELFYSCYNPETAGHEHLKNLESLGANYISTRESIEKEMQKEGGVT